MARRVVALGIVVLIVFGAVRVVGSLTVRRRPGRRRRSDPAPTVVGVDGRRSTDRCRRPTPAVATGRPSRRRPSPPDTAPEDTGPPTATNPAKVYIVGDSDAGTFGPYLQTLLDGTNIVDTELNYKVSSGLARPDFFDWPAELAAKVPEVDPDIVVATFGGNDSQGLAVADGTFIVSDPGRPTRPTGRRSTAQRVGEAMDLMGANGRTVIWVGIPNDDNPEVTARLRDPGPGGAGRGGRAGRRRSSSTRGTGSPGATATGPSSSSIHATAQGKDVRADDGFHLNTNGAEILALDIAQADPRRTPRPRRRHLTASDRATDPTFASTISRGPRSPKSRRKRGLDGRLLLLLAAGLDGLAAGGDLIGAEHGAAPGPAVAGLDLPVVVVAR